MGGCEAGRLNGVDFRLAGDGGGYNGRFLDRSSRRDHTGRRREKAVGRDDSIRTIFDRGDSHSPALGRQIVARVPKTSGFTLLEIIIVMAIIGLLTTLGLASYQSTNKRARDGKRQADLEQMRTALEIARSDSEANTYPATLGELQTGGYLTVPTDPRKFVYVYVPAGDYRTYSLCAHLEKGDEEMDKCGGTEACGKVCNYEVKSP